MGLGTIKIDSNLFLQALAFPPGTKIRACLGLSPSGAIELIVEHDALPERPANGEITTQLSPIITLVNADTLPKNFYQFDWNL